MRDHWRPEFLRSRSERERERGQHERMDHEHADAREDSSRRRETYIYTVTHHAVDPVRERAIRRARKIRALAERPGTPGEGRAAVAALARFLAANGLTVEEL